MVARADVDMVPWLEWAYCGCEDPTTAGPGAKQAIVINPLMPPAGSNLVLPTLQALVEPYPQVIAGTPLAWGFNRAGASFLLHYTTARAGGRGRLAAGALTEIATPSLVYAGRYAADVTGGAVVSRPGAPLLQIASCPGASDITVTVTPRGSSHGSCRPPRRRRGRPPAADRS